MQMWSTRPETGGSQADFCWRAVRNAAAFLFMLRSAAHYPGRIDRAESVHAGPTNRSRPRLGKGHGLAVPQNRPAPSHWRDGGRDHARAFVARVGCPRISRRSVPAFFPGFLERIEPDWPGVVHV